MPKTFMSGGVAARVGSVIPDPVALWTSYGVAFLLVSIWASIWFRAFVARIPNPVRENARMHETAIRILCLTTSETI